MYTPFPIWNQSVVPHNVLTVVSWPAYRFLRRQVRWSGIPISLIIFHGLLWSTVKDVSIVNEAEVDVFLEFLAFSMIQRMLAICSLVPLPFLNPACISESSRFTYYLKPSLKDFEHDLASMWNECNCAVVSTFFGFDLLWDGNENWPFPFLWPLLSFPDLLAYWVQHFNSIIF